MIIKDNKILRFLVGFTAMIIAVCSAAFSVYGLSLIFSGIAVAIMIMASVIELGKVVSVAFLYQRWKTINWAFRTILFAMILGGMVVTSSGIFGILSSGYEKAAVELNSQNNEISLLNNKKTYFVSQVKNLETQKGFYEQRAIQLSTLRKNQEERLDKLVVDKRSSASTDKLIKQSNTDIETANSKVDDIMLKITQLNDSIQSTDQKIQKVTLTNNNVGLDPLKYLSRTINESADKAVKWFIILLISIFDPMAIMLLMAFNQMNLDKQEPSGIANEKEPLLDRIKKKFKKKMVVSEPVVEPELISEPILEVILEPIEPEVVIPVIPEPVTPELKFEPVQFKIPFDNEDEPYEKTEDDIDFFLDIEKENEVEEKKNSSWIRFFKKSGRK